MRLVRYAPMDGPTDGRTDKAFYGITNLRLKVEIFVLACLSTPDGRTHHEDKKQVVIGFYLLLATPKSKLVFTRLPRLY